MLRLGPEYVMQTEPELAREERIRRSLVHELTGLIAEMDTFMTGLNDKVPEGPQIRIKALALRDALNRLRRHTAAGGPMAVLFPTSPSPRMPTARWPRMLSVSIRICNRGPTSCASAALVKLWPAFRTLRRDSEEAGWFPA